MVYHPFMATTTSKRRPAGEELDRIFRALGDSTRRSIVTQLTHGDASMTEIADQFDMSLPGVSKHVSVLEDAGIVHRWRHGRTRRCRLEVEPMREANAWIETNTAFWSETLESLARFVEDADQADTAEHTDRGGMP